MKKTEKILFLVLLNLAALTFLLYGFESVFSPYDDLPPNGTIDGRLYTWGHPVENNRYGFRERDFELPKPPGTYRVMVLGDSLTWGAGLGVEERYTAIAEHHLNSMVNGRQVEILNFGISGGPTIVERNILGKLKAAVDPDRIVVGFCLNDPQPRSQDYSIERQALSDSRGGRVVAEITQILRSIGLPYTGELFGKAFYRLAEMSGSIPSWQTALQRAYEPASDEWQSFLQALADIKRMSDELELPPPIFSVLNQGTYTDRPTDYRHPDENLEQFLRWYRQAEAAAGEIGFVAYNHEDEIADRLNKVSLAVNVLDGHPSAELNRIYGEKLYRTIAEQMAWKQQAAAASPPPATRLPNQSDSASTSAGDQRHPERGRAR